VIVDLQVNVPPSRFVHAIGGVRVSKITSAERENVMRGALRVLIVLGVAPLLVVAQPLTDNLREQLKIQQALLDRDLQQYEEHRANLQEAWVRVERESADMLRAQRQGESLDSLQLRDEDLRQAESLLLMHVFSIQRVRRSMLASRAVIATTEEEIRRLEEQVGVREDPLSGTWRLVMEPGGQRGFMSLRLDGTLVQGTYQLEGDWTGSLRGTYVSRKVRLERIDSQIGFAAILHGRLQGRGDNVRLQGSWEATQLASGMPSAGTWMATRERETTE
jgi:hypothetical protein